MELRLNFRHLTICFGMVSFIAYGTVMAAPVCSRVLMAVSMDEGAASILLDNLASMKLELDQARLGGELTLAHRSLNLEFQKRLEEAYEHYQGSISKEEFKELIRLRIQDKQKGEKRVEQDRVEQKVAMADLVPLERFVGERFQPDVTPKAMTYVPSNDAMIVLGNSGIFKFDFKTKKTERFLDQVPEFYTVNGEKLFYVLKNGQYASRDINSGQEQVFYPNVFEKNDKDFRKAMSTNGTWLALLNNHSTSFTVFSAHSQKPMKIKVLKEASFFSKYLDHLPFYEYIERHEFVSANELLIFTSSGRVILRNLANGDQIPIDWPKQFWRDHGMQVTEDGYMILTSFRTLGIVKVSDLANIKKHLKVKTYDNWVQDTKKVNASTLIVRTFGDAKHDYYSININDMSISSEPVVADQWQVSYDAMAVDRKNHRFFLGGWNRTGLPPGDLSTLPMIDVFKAQNLSSP